ncbi:MAG: DNA-binding protein, partial [Candidatus Aenigmatarchaeota archaeon]
ELEKIRQKKLLELQQRLAEEEEKRKERIERSNLLRVILSPEARQRLANMRLVKPELVDKIEIYLIQLAQAGKIPTPLSDDQLKSILNKLIPSKKEIRIERR